jgi:hypothetical protein
MFGLIIIEIQKGVIMKLELYRTDLLPEKQNMRISATTIYDFPVEVREIITMVNDCGGDSVIWEWDRCNYNRILVPKELA